MSDLTSIEKLKLERFFGMGGGYVLSFSNRTFGEFVLENTEIDVYEGKYYSENRSKANRLRAFWKLESNRRVGLLIQALLEYWQEVQQEFQREMTESQKLQYNECLKIAERLKRGTLVENLDAIRPDTDNKDFNLLAESIRESIEKNKPEAALDRLHTFVLIYFRQLCDKHQLGYRKQEALHGLFGKYINHLVASELVDSEMTKRILKYSIHILEAFNDVRNNESLAHPNTLLNYQESILIFNSITNTIKFIETIEHGFQKGSQKTELKWGDIPF